MIFKQKTNIIFCICSAIIMLLTLLYLSKDTYFSLNKNIILTLATNQYNFHHHHTTSECPNGGSVSLHIKPTVKLPTMTPLHLEVKIKNIIAKKVIIDISSINTLVGENKPVLTSDNYNHFYGETILPTKDTANTIWKATVLIDTGHGIIAAPFEFHGSALNIAE